MKSDTTSFRSSLLTCLAALVLFGVLLETGITHSSGMVAKPSSGGKVLSADGPIIPPTQPPPKTAA